MTAGLARIDPKTAAAEKLAAYPVLIRDAVAACEDQDELNAVEAILLAVAARLRQLGKDSSEAERTRTLALRRLGELLGPAEMGRPAETFPAGNVSGPPMPQPVATFYLLVCRVCSELDRPLVMPFATAAERGKWAAEHTRGTGHDRWYVEDEER